MKQRIITAAAALALFIPLTIYGGWPFSVFIILISSIGLWELIRMNNTKHVIPVIIAMPMLWILLVPESLSTTYVLHNKLEIIMIFVFVLLCYSVWKKNEFTFEHAGFIVFGVLYIAMGFYYFIETRLVDDGLATILYVLFIVWATDTGAYFFGRSLGKNKLWPQVSPNKTIEGAIGGIVLAAVVGVIFHLIHPFDYSVIVVLAVTVLASIFGQIGDLAESALKRHFNVKDSGNILPGHGGILDRFDSLIFVFPLLHFIQFIS